MTAVIEVLICDDDARICTALEAVIDSQPGMTHLAPARDATQAIALAREHHPAVAIVDVRMPGGGAHIARSLREVSPGTKILAFSAYDDAATAEAMRQAGAAAYLLKSTSVPGIVAAIRDLAATGDN